MLTAPRLFLLRLQPTLLYSNYHSPCCPQYDAFLAASEAISQLHAEVEDMKAVFAADHGFALGGDGDIFAQVRQHSPFTLDHGMIYIDRMIYIIYRYIISG